MNQQILGSADIAIKMVGTHGIGIKIKITRDNIIVSHHAISLVDMLDLLLLVKNAYVLTVMFSNSGVGGGFLGGGIKGMRMNQGGIIDNGSVWNRWEWNDLHAHKHTSTRSFFPSIYIYYLYVGHTPILFFSGMCSRVTVHFGISLILAWCIYYFLLVNPCNYFDL